MHPLSIPQTPGTGELEALRAELAAAQQALEAERAARVRAEEALRERDSTLNEVEGLAQLGTWEWNIASDVIRWSPEQMRIHGMPTDAGTQSFADFLGRVHPDDRARIVEECERLIATGESFVIPYRVVRPDGSLREMNALGKLLPDSSGKMVRMVGTAQDVTERNRADRALRASEARFRDLFEQFPHSVQVLSPEGETLQVNPAFDRLWGLRMDELAGYNPLEDPRMEPIRDLLRRGFAGERVTLPEVEFDTRGMHAEVGGQPWPRWIRSFVFAVRDDAGAVREVVLVHEDVTEQRRAEQALTTSEESYRTIFDSSSDAIFVTDPATGQVVDANRAACTMADASIEELRADAAAVIWNGPPPYTADLAHEQMKLAAAGVPQRFEWLSVHPRTGAEIWGEVSLQRVTLGGELRVLALVRDIGERKRAEQALRASEQSYRALFELSNDAIYVHDVETGAILDANRKAYEGAGLSSVEEVRERGMQLIAGGEAPFTPELAMEYVRRAAAGEPQRFEWRSGPAGDVGVVWSEVSLNRVTINGVERLLATARDITERKQAEQALRDSERSYRTIFDWTAAALWVHDITTGDFLDVNQTACHMYGYTVEEIRALGVGGMSWGEAPYDVEHAMEYVRRAVAGEPQRFEWLGRHKDGSPVWAEMTLRRVTINGEDRLLATGRATNEWKAAERALRASEESYRTVFDSTAAAIWVYDPDTGDLLDVNAAACELYGYDAREQKEIGLEGLMWGEAPYTLDEVQRIFERARGGEPQRFVWLGRHRNGGEVWAEVQARRVTGLGGDRLLVTARGMNEWRAAADALRRANEELEARVVERTAELAEANVALGEEVAEHEAAREELVERTRELEGVFQALPDLYFRMSPDGTITDHRAGRAAALYSPVPDFRGRRMQDVLPAGTAAHFAEALDEAGRTGQMVCVEYELAVEGESRNFEARVVPLEDGSRITVVRDITERKTAEAELLRQKAYFEEVIGSLESGVAVFTTGLRHEYCSPNTIRDPELRAWAIGRTVEEYGRRAGLPDEVIRKRHGSLACAAAERITVQFEEEIRGANGGTRHMLRRALPVLDERGELVRIIGYSVDITERKRAEEALQEREERFRTLIENAHDIITILDQEGRVVYQSPSVQRILGYTVGELTGTSAFDLVHPDDVQPVQEAMAAIVAAPGTLARAEYRYRHRDGGWRRLETFGRALPEGSVEGAAVFNSRDVTERWEADQALQRSEEHFRALIENAHDLTVIIDASGRFVYQSPSMERIYGRRRNETLGHTAWELMHPDDVPAVSAEFARVLAEPGRIGHVEYRYRHADGHWVYTEAFGRTLVPGSAVGGVVVNARDVTERRLAEEALRRATQEAERANRAKSEFLSRMSHELRTPMNSILGFAQVLGRAGLTEAHNKYLQHILKGGRHLLNLINEVLEISRIESGRQSLSLEPVYVRTVLQEALGLVRPLAEQRRVELDEAPWVADEDAYVYADRQRLTQVVLNLLSNAVKYNRPGGRVRLWCATEPGEEAGGPWVRVRIEDTGPGIPADRADQLFTPFARLGAEQTEVEGTGLGLALSLRLAEAMGGDLVLESSGNAGSVFRLDLRPAENPVNRAEDSALAPAAPGELPRRAARVLYIEDNLANLALVETFLMPRPEWQTIPALQGLVGLEMAREHQPDLVLLDLHLPDMHGSEVLRRLRADARTSRIPVVVISADATHTAVQELLAAGADAYLTKPLDLDEFLRTLEQFLPEAAA